MSSPKRMTLCTVCNGGHYDKAGNGKCGKCRQKGTSRRCPTCGKAMRTELESMAECMSCTGIAKYGRLLRAERKESK